MTSTETSTDVVEDIAGVAKRDGLRIVTAESLTSGHLSARLGVGPDAAVWFGGGVVAYHSDTKFKVLGVREGPVVTATCAEQMAHGAMRLLGADVAVSTTGVGGPGPSEGMPAGTVFITVATAQDTTSTRELHLEGEPDEVLDQCCDAALALLAEVLVDSSHDPNQRD
jgi:nicotinamide-nucleotide amidase